MYSVLQVFYYWECLILFNYSVLQLIFKYFGKIGILQYYNTSVNICYLILFDFFKVQQYCFSLVEQNHLNVESDCDVGELVGHGDANTCHRHGSSQRNTWDVQVEDREVRFHQRRSRQLGASLCLTRQLRFNETKPFRGNAGSEPRTDVLKLGKRKKTNQNSSNEQLS